MEEPVSNTTTSASERLNSTPETWSTTLLRSTTGTTTLLNRWGTPVSDQRYVAETLEWIAAELGAKRARFVRLLPSGVWIIQTVVQGKIVAQPADRAEIAMAWAASLSRDVYCASRPRVTTLNGEGIRPIAMTSYIAIPVLCQQGLAGVIEAAGDLRSDAERIARNAGDRLTNFAARLMFDPALRAEPRVTMDTECEITSGLGSTSFGVLSAAEWKFVSCIRGSMALAEIVDVTGLDEDQIIELARGLVSRGLITLRTPTGLLMSSTTSLLGELPPIPSTV